MKRSQLHAQRKSVTACSGRNVDQTAEQLLTMDDSSPRFPDVTTWSVALLCVLAVAVGGAFSALVRYDLVGFGHLPRAAVYPIFWALLLNALALRLWHKRPMDSQRLMYLYVAVLVMAGFPGQQLVTYLYLIMIAGQGYATPENKYMETFMPYVPDWMIPARDPDAPAIRWAFQGVPMGHSMPWRPWVVPLLAWSPVLIGLLAMQMTLAAWLRRRWADEERVLFPLARIPVEFVRYDSPTALFPACFRSPLFWIAFALPVLIFSKNALHYYFPAIPETRLQRDIGWVFRDRPWTVLNGWPYHVYFEMVGVTYLVQDDMGFSLWFFWVLRRFLMVFREAYGLSRHADFFTHQGLGAYTLLAAVYFWLARHALADMWRKAFGVAGNLDDSNEPMSYRVAAIGFVASVVIVLVWARLAGASVGYTALMLLLYIVGIIVVCRLVAEGGLFAVWTPIDRPHIHLVRIFGPKALGARTLTILHYVGWKIGDTASNTMANILQAYKISDLAGLHPRGAALLIAVSLLVALFASHPTALYAIYSRSVPGLGWWPRAAFGGFGIELTQLLTAPRMYTAGNYGNMALGAAVTMALQFLRQRYVWWPLHPLAYVAIISGPQFMGDRYGFSILVGWIIRRLVQRFGGYSAYNAIRPAAIGVVAGNAVVLLTWTIVHYFHPISGVLIIE
ncbi:MAG: hypothetical protein H5T86_01555 [Armatimonadetes bacterium]|nr:hypothetical protein [Armatimonadota bacterium]